MVYAVFVKAMQAGQQLALTTDFPLPLVKVLIPFLLLVLCRIEAIQTNGTSMVAESLVLFQ
jgi:hypothetical protein